MIMNRALKAAVIAALLLAPSVALAQKPVTLSDVVSESVTIEAIDHAKRIVTLKDKNGIVADVLCGPEVQRFDALKVGDKVTFSFRESIATAIQKAGAAPKPAQAASVTRTPGTSPGGTIAQEQTITVTIEAIDAKVPSVTIKADNGRRMSFRVQNAKNLEGYKAGDKVDITYTQALAVSVTPAGK
jgi:Cu/Ag efflux protein CusF